MTSPVDLNVMPIEFQVVGETPSDIHRAIVKTIREFIDSSVVGPIKFDIVKTERFYVSNANNGRPSRWKAVVTADIHYNENQIVNENIEDPVAKELDEYRLPD